MFSTYLPIDIPEFSYHHVTFLLTNPFQYPIITIRNHAWVHWFDWCEGLYHYTTLTYEPFSVSNVWHMKQCLRTLVLLIRRTVFTVKRHASTPRFDLHAHVRVQIWTHEPMSVCSFEHNPIASSKATVRRDNVQFFTKRRFCALFWLTRTSPGANFHIEGPVWMQHSHTKSCQR